MQAQEGPSLTAVVIPLLKGVVYREAASGLWNALLDLQARVRDYVSVLALDLVIDEAEGYAFLRSRPAPEDDDPVPRLIARRPLAFHTSLLLALLRRRLAEFDAQGGQTRLVLSRDQIVELLRVFLPDGTNEVRLVNQVDTLVNKVVDLGFLRKLKTSDGEPSYEVSRILKAFVDAQWLSDFDERLAAYRAHLVGGGADA